jgi:hypothetical protein
MDKIQLSLRLQILTLFQSHARPFCRITETFTQHQYRTYLLSDHDSIL